MEVESSTGTVGPVWLALEDSLPIRRANVAAGDELDETWIVFADQHTAFVAGTDQCGANGTLTEGAVIVAVKRGSRDRGYRPSGNKTLHEAASRNPLLGRLL